MKRVLSLFLTIILIMAVATAGVYGASDKGNNKKEGFRDIQGNWGFNSIMKMQEKGILQGYEDGTFRPDQTLTQDEIAVLLDRVWQLHYNADEDWDSDDQNLNGVPEWAKNSVAKGIQKQYINMNRFHSQVQCDRLLAVVQLAKALGVEPVDPKDFDENPFQFRDKELISDEDYGYLLAMVNKGYLKGFPDGNFNPNRFMSRVQMAALIDKVLGDENPDPADKEAPIWPTGSAVTASAITSESITLTWSAATDNTGVTLYRVNYNDVTDQVKYISSGRVLTITGLTPEKEFNFTLFARDAAGNWSAAGPSVKASTLAAPDTIAIALQAINDANTINEMHQAVTTHAVTLGLSLTEYNGLLDRTTVLEELLSQTFTDKTVLKTVFDEAVEEAQ